MLEHNSTLANRQWLSFVTSTGLSPIVSMAKFSNFSWAEENLKHVETRWEDFKEKGNNALLADPPGIDEAIRMYEAAFLITQQPFPQMRTLENIGQKRPDSALSRFIKASGTNGEPLMLLFLMPYLMKPLIASDKEEIAPGIFLNRTFPNRPAAICKSNIAAARLKRYRLKGDPTDLEEALADAEEALNLCPEYVKGHSRMVSVLTRLATDLDISEEIRRDLRKQAASKRLEIKTFEELIKILPWNGIVLKEVGWIDEPQYTFMYEQVRWDYIMEQLRRLAEREEVFGGGGGGGGDGDLSRSLSLPYPTTQMIIQVSISLVASGGGGGQSLAFDISYIAAHFQRGKVDRLRYARVDSGGSEQLRESPHGMGTKLALERTIDFTAKWILDIMVPAQRRNPKTVRGFEVAALVLGQGLVCHQEELTLALQEKLKVVGLHCPKVLV